jgi:hypothetical protein
MKAAVQVVREEDSMGEGVVKRKPEHSEGLILLGTVMRSRIDGGTIHEQRSDKVN